MSPTPQSTLSFSATGCTAAEHGLASAPGHTFGDYAPWLGSLEPCSMFRRGAPQGEEGRSLPVTLNISYAVALNGLPSRGLALIM